MLRLAAGWAGVAAFLYAGQAFSAALATPAGAFALFVALLALIIWMAFGVVHEAEELAEFLGDPLGTLILTLSIVIIEVALISAVMLGAKSAPTLGRDTMFSVLMIVLNGVVGIGLLLGGLRYRVQEYNLQGAGAYLSVIIPLSVIALILPNFTVATGVGTLSKTQALFFSLCTVVIYGAFLLVQTGRYKDFFTDPRAPSEQAVTAAAREGEGMFVLRHTALLVANVLPIVILAKGLAQVLDVGIVRLGAPAALGGVLIAGVVFLPECVTALRAISANDLTRAMNLFLGACASTLGLTVPAVLFIGIVMDQTVIFGLSPTNMVLLATTLMLSTLTFSSQRTTLLHGVVHLCMFFVFLVLIFDP
jgi:Ca2+:H+ antiporter